MQIELIISEPQPDHSRHQTRRLPTRSTRRFQLERLDEDQQALQLLGHFRRNRQPEPDDDPETVGRKMQRHPRVSNL